MTTTTYPTLQARKPVGGFIFLTVQQLCLLWWAYRSRLIQLIDFRVWFAAQEMVARRCQKKAPPAPVYTHQELHKLVGGVGGQHLRASLRRLNAQGLLSWSTTQLTFLTAPTDLHSPHDLTDLHTMLDAVPHHDRRVPMPRQVVRLIAGGVKISVLATMLGHLIRCLYYHAGDQRCVSGGWCKASWIADVFRVDPRNVKAARKHLVALGWLQMPPVAQYLCNRWGNYALVSLTWERAVPNAAPTQVDNSTETPLTQSPPPPVFSTTPLPPPSKGDPEPFQDPKYQEPAFQADPVPVPQPLPPPHPPPADRARLVFGRKKRPTPQSPQPRRRPSGISYRRTSGRRPVYLHFSSKPRPKALSGRARAPA